MAANEFMGDLDIPTIPASPSSILLPTAARNYELKSSHLNMLPSFYGLPNEDPLTHIKDIFNAVSSFPLTGVTEDQLRMRVFPYTLKDKAKYWLNSLKPGGSYKTKTPEETYELFEAIAMETQHTDTRGKRIVGGSNDSSSVQISKLEQKLDALLALSSRNPSKEVCSICETHDHPTISCPLGAAYPEFVQEQAKLVNSYNRGPINDPYSQSYNPGKIVDNKVGSDLSNDVVVVENEDEEETTAVEGERPKTSQSAPKAKSDSQEPNPFQLHKRDDKFVPPHLCEDRYIPPPPYIPPIPFPGRLKKANQDKAFKEIYDILSKVNINLPLLDVVKQIPAYGKFIKHLITHKLNFAPSEEVKLNKNVSAVLQRKLPPKLEDPGSFDIPINIGDKKAGRAMLDLGASINVMPYSVYQEL
ncbi:unnamed protein product, partial [Prunus brigantina]